MEVFVFSYNRGRFLRNCLNSIRECLSNAPVTIVDDNSDDPKVLSLLEKYRDDFRIIQVNKTTDARYGGLYPNMQTTISQYGTSDYLLFVQDDTQLVRRFTEDDMQYIRDYFGHYQDAVFLSPSFLKKNSNKRNQSIAQDSEYPVYFVGNEANNAYFSAITIVNRKRILEKGFTLGRGEQATGSGAREKGLHKMGQMAHPFVAWLPFVPNFRGKKESLAMRLAKRFGTVGYFPFRIMSDEEVRALKGRDLNILPIMEEFLHPEGLDSTVNPIWYHDPVEQHPLIKKISRYELKAQRFKRRVKALFRADR